MLYTRRGVELILTRSSRRPRSLFSRRERGERRERRRLPRRGGVRTPPRKPGSSRGAAEARSSPREAREPAEFVLAQPPLLLSTSVFRFGKDARQPPDFNQGCDESEKDCIRQRSQETDDCRGENVFGQSRQPLVMTLRCHVKEF